MCETTSRASGRPRWGWLYGAALPPLAALAIVEAATLPNVLRIVLRCTLALAALIGIVLWIRANRPAFDLLEWCNCAAATITVRVLESRRPAASSPFDPPGPARADEEAHELVRG